MPKQQGDNALYSCVAKLLVNEDGDILVVADGGFVFGNLTKEVLKDKSETVQQAIGSWFQKISESIVSSEGANGK